MKNHIYKHRISPSIVLIVILLINQSFAQNLTGKQSINSRNQITEIHIDTTNIKGDSIFILVKEYEKNSKVLEQQKVIIGNKTVLHGESKEWFPDGKEKSEGKYLDGEKWGLWRYWDNEGNMTQVTDQRDQDITFRSDIKYFYKDGVKVNLRDKNENSKNDKVE